MRIEKMRRYQDELVLAILYLWGLYHLVRLLISH